eukprot:5905682-Alexandrium_andersonii.AAC.1
MLSPDKPSWGKKTARQSHRRKHLPGIVALVFWKRVHAGVSRKAFSAGGPLSRGGHGRANGSH